MSLAKLIVIDDEPDFGEFVCEVAELSGFETEHYDNGALFKENYTQDADVILLDLMMPEIDGIEVIRYLAATKCNALLVLMSGFDSAVLHSAQKLTIEHGLTFAGILSKPFRFHELQQLLDGLCVTPQNHRSAKKNDPPTVKELRHALSNHELVVYYQPKVRLSTQPIAAVEALVRWQHPSRGLLAPDSFIQTAETHGLIDELTWVVLNQVMAQCKIWRGQDLLMQVAINMSTSTLKDLCLPEKMEQLIKEHTIKASQIILEITESALMQELITSLDILTRLRIKGIRLSLDDFGTGYSSMVQLHRAPFSEIKIDRSFVSAMENDPEAAAIVETIIMLGHKLNMTVIAEGVETDSCQKILTELGCDQAQGYLFSRPIPASEIPPWFSRYSNSY